jgi:Arc/MetJ-type ribon-helix-helix transcriptional regulator
MLAFRSPLDLTHQVDAWIAEQPEPRPSRSDAIRFALRDWLATRPAAVAPPALPPPSDAFLRALEMSEAKTKARGPGVRLRKAAR